MPNGSNVQWCKHYPDGDEIKPNGVGGDISQFIPVVAMNLGDIVFFSGGNDSVTKGILPSAYNGMAGVVVGGDLTQDFIAEDAQMASNTILQVCTAGKRVLVQMSGIAWVMSGAVAVAGGVPVTVDGATAGRVSITGAVSGVIVGTTINASAAGATRQKMFVCPR